MNNMIIKRFLAIIIDTIVIGSICATITIIAWNVLEPYLDGMFMPIFAVIMSVGSVMAIFKDVTGQSIGKKITKIKVIDRGSSNCGFAVRKILRNITCIVWPIELFVLIVGQNHRRLSDTWLNLDVVYVL